MIQTIPQNPTDPNSKDLNPTAYCEYYSKDPGHNTEQC